MRAEEIRVDVRPLTRPGDSTPLLLAVALALQPHQAVEALGSTPQVHQRPDLKMTAWAVDGSLYGATSLGGSSGDGTVFRLDGLRRIHSYSAGESRANNGIVLLGAAGDTAVVCGQASGTVQAIIDVNGYFQ